MMTLSGTILALCSFLLGFAWGRRVPDPEPSPTLYAAGVWAVSGYDGAYLLTHPTERDRFKRVAENASLIKQHICDLAPTACSWQFARPAKGGSGGSGNVGNGKKPAQTGDEIGYTDAILQLSSLALGLMQPESAETIKQREVSILKGRNGETGSFTVNWNFDWTTDFSEVTEKVEELEVE